MSARKMTQVGVVAMLPQWWPLLLGNVLEWYDFGVYGFLAKQVSGNFFNGSQIDTWIGFSITFLLRPVGGLLLGRLADRSGRKVVVVCSMAGMLAATVGQGCLPTRDCCGEGAGHFGAALLLLLRALQGLSAGGEVGSIATYFAETAPRGMKARGTAAVMVCAVLAFLLANGVVELVLLALGPDRMMLWGWRVPFLLALPPGLVSLWGRGRLAESTEFLAVAEQQAQHASRPEHTRRPAPTVSTPSGDAASDSDASKSQCRRQRGHMMLMDHALSVAVGFGCSCAGGCAFYLGIWAAHRAVHMQGGLTESQGLLVSMLTMAVIASTIAVWSYLCDKYGGSDPFLGVVLGGACLAIACGPVFAALDAWPGSMPVAVVCLSVCYGLATGLAVGPLYLLAVELFPTEIRVLGFGLSFNLAFSYVGGTASLAAQALEGLSPLAPGFYVAGVGGLSAAVAVVARCLRAKGTLPSYLVTAKAPVDATQDEDLEARV